MAKGIGVLVIVAAGFGLILGAGCAPERDAPGLEAESSPHASLESGQDESVAAHDLGRLVAAYRGAAAAHGLQDAQAGSLLPGLHFDPGSGLQFWFRPVTIPVELIPLPGVIDRRSTEEGGTILGLTVYRGAEVWIDCAHHLDRGPALAEREAESARRMEALSATFHRLLEESEGR